MASLLDKADYLNALVAFEARCLTNDGFREKHRGVLGSHIVDVSPATTPKNTRPGINLQKLGDDGLGLHPVAGNGVFAYSARDVASEDQTLSRAGSRVAAGHRPLGCPKLGRYRNRAHARSCYENPFG